MPTLMDLLTGYRSPLDLLPAEPQGVATTPQGGLNLAQILAGAQIRDNWHPLQTTHSADKPATLEDIQDGLLRIWMDAPGLQAIEAPGISGRRPGRMEPPARERGDLGEKGTRFSPKRYGELLHGTAHDFVAFRRGPHGLTYLSEPRPGRKTQAEAIASGPFGGRLLRVALDEDRMKLFDPYNDPVAQELGRPFFDPYNPGSKSIDYVHAPALLAVAAPRGYNTFEFYEPAVRDKSVAVSDPTLLRILSSQVVRE